MKDPKGGWQELEAVAKKYKLVHTTQLKAGDYIVYWDIDNGVKHAKFIKYLHCQWLGHCRASKGCPKSKCKGYLQTEFGGHEICTGFGDAPHDCLARWKVSLKKWNAIKLIESY